MSDAVVEGLKYEVAKLAKECTRLRRECDEYEADALLHLAGAQELEKQRDLARTAKELLREALEQIRAEADREDDKGLPVGSLNSIHAIADGALTTPVSVTRNYQEMVRNMIIGVHPLPWTVEQDWTWEVSNGAGVIIGKFKTKTEAEDFVAFGQEIEAELDLRAKELEVELARADKDSP